MIELDVWDSRRRIGIEYHGEHHYHDLHLFASSQSVRGYSERDKKKAAVCVEVGITLVLVPYWWDQSVFSLHSLLMEYLPCGTAPLRSEPSVSDLTDAS